jgi:hypothetical protein
MSVCLLCSVQSLAQFDHYPLVRLITEEIEQAIAHPDSTTFLSFKPYLRNTIKQDSLNTYITNDRRYFNLFEVKFFKEHLFIVHEDDFDLFIDPVTEIELGYDFKDQTEYQDSTQLRTNIRGLRLAGQIGGLVSFETIVYENQAFYPNYLREHIDSTGVAPGQGRTKVFRTSGFDYAGSSGSIGFKPAPWLQVHLGTGKHFIGTGYRSMLLSDNAFNYPFLRFRLHIPGSKWEYIKMYSETNNLDRLPLGEVPESLFKKKGFGMHYLNWSPHPRLEVGLFEGVVWERWDSTGTKPVPLLAAQPIPLLDAAILGLENEHNAVLGLNLNFKVSSNFRAYGQLVVDKLNEDGMGYQAGFKWKNILSGLDFQAEVNHGGVQLFASKDPLNSYTHHNEPMAHPFGAAFDEVVVILNHHRKRFWSQVRVNAQRHDFGIGGDVLSSFGEVLPEQTMTTILQGNAEIGVTINPNMRLQALFGFTYRDADFDSGHQVTAYPYIAIRTSLRNKYYDF